MWTPPDTACTANLPFLCYTRIIRLDGLGQAIVVHLVVRLWCRTGAGRIARLDGSSIVVRLSWQISKDSSCRRVVHLVLVLMLETYKRTKHKCLLKLVQTDYTT